MTLAGCFSVTGPERGDMPKCPLCGDDEKFLASHIRADHETGLDVAEEVIGNVSN